jgi:hypothetical protein
LQRPVAGLQIVAAREARSEPLRRY